MLISALNAMENINTERCSGKHSVQHTIELLTKENAEDVCDDSHPKFKECEILPPFYDEDKFKSGQRFFYKHIFAMMLAKLLGLVTIISTPNIISILTFTKMSSEPMTAYHRYLATIFHMCVWYESDFTPGSKLWNSVVAVKNIHNSASKRSCAAGAKQILQKDMSITQFGFMGYVVVHPELIGIHYTNKKELEGFIHLWRVIGYLLGMDDRYNICRDSVTETKQICEALVAKVFVPNIKKHNPEYLKLADALITGMWVLQPMLETKAYMMYMYNLLNLNINNAEDKLPPTELSRKQRFNLALIKTYAFYLKYTLVRWYSNAKMHLSFWLIRNFPFLAYYKYGYKNSYVSIYLGRGQNTR